MEEFWINNGWSFIWFPLFLLLVCYATTPYYTGAAKKLDLMARDILEKGEVMFNTQQFDSFLNNKGVDPFRISMITHLFFSIPRKEKYPVLYKHPEFLQQVRKLRSYRRFYAIMTIPITICICFITIMVSLYGSHLK